jgi:hypothetical protein
VGFCGSLEKRIEMWGFFFVVVVVICDVAKRVDNFEKDKLWFSNS